MTEQVPEPMCRIDEVAPGNPNHTCLRYFGPFYDYAAAPGQPAIVRYPDGSVLALGSVAAGGSLYDFLIEQGAFTAAGGLREVYTELAHFKALCLAPGEEFLLGLRNKTSPQAKAIIDLMQACEAEVERVRYSEQVVMRLRRQLTQAIAAT